IAQGPYTCRSAPKALNSNAEKCLTRRINMPRTLFNTGVDANGAQLAPKSVDKHWQLIHGPQGAVNPPTDARVLETPPGTYFHTSDSMWIWADPLGTAIPGSPGPDYVFQTKFLLEFDPELEWIEIRGIWGADNSGEIKIDGHPFPPGSVSGEVSLPQGPTTPIDTNCTQPHQF